MPCIRPEECSGAGMCLVAGCCSRDREIDDETADRIIYALDDHAREVDMYDYGLPVGRDGSQEAMRKLIRDALRPQTEGQTTQSEDIQR